MKTFKELLISLSACKKAREWAGDTPVETIVATCQRGDWLLWLAKNVDVPLKELTLAKGHCAKTVVHLMKDERSKKAVQAAIDFGEGRITIEELKNAAADAAAAYAAAAHAYAAAAYAAAAYAAAYAANAANAAAANAAAAYAAAYAANAANAAAAYAANAANAAAAYAANAANAAAADAAAADAARNKILAETADICRKYIGSLIVEKVNELLQ